MHFQHIWLIFSLLCLQTWAQGCTSGYYGKDCTKRCPPTCKTGDCSPSGLCDECTPGLYGIRCNHYCPTTCIQTECFRYNVTCTQGCKTGWYGNKCEKLCTDCVGGCHRDTGRCLPVNGPQALPLKTAVEMPPRCGLDSKLPDKCVAGCWGEKCKTSCPDICLQCNDEEKCTSCEAGRYGERCEKTCPDSCSQTCDMHGECVTAYRPVALAIKYGGSNSSGTTTPSLIILAVMCGIRLW